jgi:Transglutaminase-like superfamily
LRTQCGFHGDVLPSAGMSDLRPSTPTDYLQATPRIDCAASCIRAAVDVLGTVGLDAREKAVRIHDYVRDQVLFGWSLDFDRHRASAVLCARRGYCNTKSGLFVALLRASGIPARTRFAAINRDVLRGLVRPPTLYVDHSYVEVFVGGAWIATDSFIVDRPLFAAAQRRLQREGAQMGYGVHRRGVADWNGRADSFVQFVPGTNGAPVRGTEFGVYADLDAFYASGQGHGAPGPLLRLLLRGLLALGNARAAALRAAPMA